MKTIITNYRYWVLAMLIYPAITLLVGIPDDGGDIFRFLVLLLITKCAAVLLAFAAMLLFEHWDKLGEIPELTRLIDQC